MAFAFSCSGPAPEPPKPGSTVKPTSHQPPKDLAAKLLTPGQIKVQLVSDHLLDKDFMPGGNLAEYKTEAGNYRVFLMEAADARAAAFMLLDWKNVMPDAKYIAHMGGYFGMDQGKPTYIFSKGPYLTGIVDLPEEKADAEARRLAARL